MLEMVENVEHLVDAVGKLDLHRDFQVRAGLMGGQYFRTGQIDSMVPGQGLRSRVAAKLVIWRDIPPLGAGDRRANAAVG